MADRDKDGVEDNIDIDGGNGTNKAASTTPLADAQELSPGIAAIINAVMASSGETKNPRSGTNTATSKTKLTKNTALAIMKLAAENAGYTVKFTNADVEQFMKEFDTEQNRQIEKVVTSSSEKVTPGGTTKGAVDRTISSTAKTEYPSFFDAGEFTSNWVWKKVDFNNEATLGAKSLGVLAQVRGLVDQFNIFGVSDKDAKAAAKAIAKGDMTLADYTVSLQKIAIKEYPQFADRFAKDPTLTTYDIASPIVKMLAKTWQMEEKDIDWKVNPIVMSYTNFAGADGKGTPPSYYDLLLKAKNDPKYQLTEEANNNARDSATEFARAFGFGV
jgi:hypothetical protein